MKFKISYLISFLLFTIQITFGQSDIYKSFLNQIKGTNSDTLKIRYYDHFIEENYLNFPDSVMPLSKRMLELCNRGINFKNDSIKNRFYLVYKSKAINNIGYVFSEQGIYPEAIKYYYEALKIQEKISDQSQIATSYNNLGFVFYNQQDAKNALDHYFKGLKIREAIRDTFGIAQTLNNIGLTYKKLGDPNCKSSIEDVCKKGGITKALEYYERSLEIMTKIENLAGINIAYNNLGGVYRELKDFNKALNYYVKSLEYRKKTNNQSSIALCLNNIGNTYFGMKDIKKAEEYSLQALEIAYKINNQILIVDCASALSKVYESSKDYEKAYNILLVANKTKLLTNNPKISKEVEKMRLGFEYNRKMREDSLKVEKEHQIMVLKVEHEKSQKFSLIIGLIVVVFFSIFTLNRVRLIQKQKMVIESQKQIVEEKNKIIEEKQKAVMDSIYYAQRIQKALITSEKYIVKQLNRLKKP